MNKNSVIPLVMLAVVVLAFPLFIHDRDSQGYNGPSLYVGIYRGQEGRFIPSIEKAAINIENTVEIQEAVLGKAAMQNYQQGLEGPSWNNTVIVAEDDHAVTKSVVKGLAELMTGMLAEDPYGFAMPFYLTHVQPHGKNVRPWGASRIIRISTQEADLHPKNVADAFSAKVNFCIQDPRLPEQSRAYLPLAAGGIKERGLSVSHHSEGTGAKSEALNWASWHATLGRSIASTAMRTCFGGECEEMDWQLLDYDTQFGAWREYKEKAEGAEQEYGDKQLLPVQADHNVVRWFCGFQEPLARGWSGSIIGLKQQSKMGTMQETVAKWRMHLDKSGLWASLPEMEKDVYVWETRNKDPNKLDLIFTKEQAYGADVLTWMMDPQIESVYKTWVDRATAGDANARVLLRRYLLCAYIPEELRDQGLALLREGATLADNAIIGLHASSTQIEKDIASAVSYVRGISNERSGVHAQAVTPLLATIENPVAIDWDRKPFLIKTPGLIAVFLAQPLYPAPEEGEQRRESRVQVWWRDLADGSQAQRVDFKNGSAQIGQMQLRCSLVGEALKLDFSLKK